MIEIKDVTKTFEKKTVASNHLSLSIDRGIIGFVGENGAGKSTLFRLIANVIHPDHGEILIDSIPNSKKEAKEKIFYLPDDPYVKSSSTIDSIFDFYNAFYTIDKARFNNFINTFELPRNRKVMGFSKGMRRQLFIAIALSVKADYLLLDEAFDGLDPLIMAKIKSYIFDSKEERKAIVIASHNINALNQLADKVLLLSKGSLMKDGSVEDLAKTLVKYQIALDGEITRDGLNKAGFHVVSIKKLGSIYHLVVYQDEKFIPYMNETYKPKIMDEIPLDPEEIVTLNMLDAKGETK